MGIPTYISIGVTIAFLLGFLFMTLETHLLLKQQHPITWYTRNLISHHYAKAQVIAGLFLIGTGWAVTHFVFDVACHG